MKTQDIPLFSSPLGHGNSHFRRKITIIPPEFPFFKIVRCTTTLHNNRNTLVIDESIACPPPFPLLLPLSPLLFFASGSDSKMSDVDGQPYTTLLYSNGPGYTQPRNILREAGKDSIQVKEKKKKEKRKKRERKKTGTSLIFSRIYSKIYISGAMFIGSENDRGEISGARLKIHHALSRGSFAKYSMELFPTSYIPSSILSNHPLLHTLLPLDSRFRPEIIALALPT